MIPPCRYPLRNSSKGKSRVAKGIGWQGDRILSCSGEHHQQRVFVKTTEKAFLSQAHVV